MYECIEKGVAVSGTFSVHRPHPLRFYDIVFSYYFLIINRKETYFLIHRREAARLILELFAFNYIFLTLKLLAAVS